MIRSELKILFVARNYPPVIGGLEKNAEDYYRNVSKIANVDLLANPLGKKHLAAFTLKTIFYLINNGNKYDIVHFNDAVLSPLIPIIRAFSKAKITFTVHGLDVVYDNPVYQFLVRLFLKRADRVFAISRYTRQQSIDRGVKPEKLSIIPDGLTPGNQNFYNEKEVQSFLAKYSLKVQNKKILVSIGRLVERKGHAWFIKSVFPIIPKDFIYLIGGEGPERPKLLNLIQETGLSERVFAIGRVTEEEKEIMYQIADLFIMPNISMNNDPEGFGIVLLEAGSFNLPVVATDIEGISSAVLDGITGRLVPEKDVERFVSAITYPDIDRTKIKSAIEKNFNWKNIAQQYIEEFQLLIKSHISISS